MASDSRQPAPAEGCRSKGLDADEILEAVLPYAAALCFFLAALVAAHDERRCDGEAGSVATLAPVMSTGRALPVSDGECKPQAAVSGTPTE